MKNEKMNRPNYVVLFLYLIVCVYFIINSFIVFIIMNGGGKSLLFQMSIAQITFSIWVLALTALGLYKKWFLIPLYKALPKNDDVLGWDAHDASRQHSVYV